MVVGEGPGEEEDKQGVPFVGRAGQLLTRMLASVGFDRERDCYIANVVKCRPERNRNPEPDEVAACSPFLMAQIDTVRPHVILALGNFAAQTLLGTKEGITRLRGTHLRLPDRGAGADLPSRVPAAQPGPGVQAHGVGRSEAGAARIRRARERRWADRRLIADIVFDIPIDHAFSYAVPAGLDADTAASG